MKRKIITIFFSMFVIGLMSVNYLSDTNFEKGFLNINLNNIVQQVKADGEIDPECPNGCVSCATGCYCYNYYPTLTEAEW